MLKQWAEKWGISPKAMQELATTLQFISLVESYPMPDEASVSGQVRIEASRKGCLMWRNNVGVLQDDRGVPVRYGLANDTKAVNKVLKSSDLIGIRPVIIEQRHVGTKIGQFLAREVKRADWRYTASEREQAQLNFISLVQNNGGDALFTNGTGSI